MSKSLRTLAGVVCAMAFVWVAISLGACCKSLSCASTAVASRELACPQGEVEADDVTDRVQSAKRSKAVRSRRYKKAKGCQRVVYLECEVVGSNVNTDQSMGQGLSAGQARIPQSFEDPQWRCWTIQDPFTPPPPAEPAPDPKSP
jgi:hypothetical protein